MKAGREKERDCHRINDGDERQGEQPDCSLNVGSGYPHQLGEVSDRSHFSLGALSLRLDPGPFGLQVRERLRDGGVDPGSTPVDVRNLPALYSETGLDVCGSVGKGEIYGGHMAKMGTGQDSEYAYRVQAHQGSDYQDEDVPQE